MLRLTLLCIAAAAAAACSHSDAGTASSAAATATPVALAASPAVEGTWAGEWGPYNPATNLALKKEDCNIIGAKVVRQGEQWKAEFTGQCSRPYAYTINMDGEQHGNAVLFRGTVDLGPADGGVYDWVGRATDDQFIGFYSNAYHTGVFHMAKAAPAQP